MKQDPRGGGICISTIDFRVHTYYPLTGRVEKTSVIDSSFTNQTPITTVQNFDYENALHQLPTRITKTTSKNESIITQNKYPQDFVDLSSGDELTDGIKHFLITMSTIL